MRTPPVPPPLDAGIALAARALAAGQPLPALGHLGPRRDAHALALRGIALAQLGELDRARRALVAALRRFRRARAPLWAAKSAAALAEVDLARRDLVAAERTLDSRPLRALGDAASAAYLDILRARLLGLLRHPAAAEAVLRGVPWGPAAALARAELLARRGRFAAAARVAQSVQTENPLLAGEARRLGHELTRPAFTWRHAGCTRTLSLLDVERLHEPYVDAIRRRFGGRSLARTPAAFALLLALARGPVTARRLYGATNDALAARLKVEISRLRRATGLCIRATPRGFETAPIGVLLPATDPIGALLADGAAWPPGAIAAALGRTVRSVERDLARVAGVRAVGRHRNRRYLGARPGTGIATQLLLLADGPTG